MLQGTLSAMAADQRPPNNRATGPIGGQMNQIVLGLTRRFHIQPLMERHSSTTVMGAFALVNGIISIGLLAAAAWLTGSPFVFPSLGPTAFLFFYTPTAASAAPRNTIFGHLIGALAGYGSLLIFGLTDAPAALASEVTLARVGAACISLGLTSGFMIWFKVPHPPAGATTLIISLGILRTPGQLAVLMLAVVLLTVQGFVINRLAGIPYPIWAPRL